MNTPEFLEAFAAYYPGQKIGTAARQRTQARDLSSMHTPVVWRAWLRCPNFFGQGSKRVRLLSLMIKIFDFCSEKEGSKTKKKTEEEKKEKGDCQPQTWKSFFWEFVGLDSSGTWSPRRRESNASAGCTTGPSSWDWPSWRRWCIQLTRLTLVCEVIRYRLVQVRQNLKKKKKKKNTFESESTEEAHSHHPSHQLLALTPLFTQSLLGTFAWNTQTVHAKLGWYDRVVQSRPTWKECYFNENAYFVSEEECTV